MTTFIPSTLGGSGWRPRNTTHAGDVRAGAHWRRCGQSSEFGRLAEVTLCCPDATFVAGGDPDELLFLEWPDPILLRHQALAVGSFYRAHGITVHWTQAIPASPNFLFQRDLYFMTPAGAVLARPGSEQRAGEARVMALALARLGIPILGMPTGDATFEGADALWLRANRVLVGVGRRTNPSGVAFLRRLLDEQDVELLPVELPHGVQHLLGLVNIIDSDLAAVRQDLASAALLRCLESSGIRPIPCEPGPDLTHGFGMNFVTLAPRHVVMPAGHPEVRRRLSALDVQVDELDVGEYQKAAGGLGCLTGILRREAS